MDNVKQIFNISRNTFLEERNSKRVIMGYVLGVALLGYWLHNFMLYVWSTGEAINVLEAFVVVEHHDKALLFMLLGWLLIISDAPFVRGNTYLILCRSSRKKWNVAMLQYITFQAFLYVAILAGISIMVSSFWGFFGKMWSSPVYHLALDRKNLLGVQYDITFPWLNMMKNMTVPQAFTITYLFVYFYFVLLGGLLYVCNLFLKEVYGILIVFGMQLIGYLLQQEGLVRLSIMAKAIPGYSIDGNGGQWTTLSMFVGVIFLVAVLSIWIVEWVEFKNVAEDE